MDGARSKLIVKKHQETVVEPTELDLSVAKAIFDLQSNSSELSGELSVLKFYGVREVDVPANSGSSNVKALVLVVPVPQLKAWHRIQTRIVNELEKKFSGRDFVIIGYRRIMPKPKHGGVGQSRPRSRTLTAVHDAWLEDIVYPTEIVGKRIRVKTDGSRVSKALLDPKDKTVLSSKVDSFSAVFKKLTGKTVVFEFPTDN